MLVTFNPYFYLYSCSFSFSCWFGYSCLSFRSCFTYMYAFASSWLSPLLACHTLHTPHLTQFCTAIAYLPCLLAAPFLLNTHFMHLVYSSFVACFLLVTNACFPLNTRLGPYIFAYLLHAILWLFA